MILDYSDAYNAVEESDENLNRKATGDYNHGAC